MYFLQVGSKVQECISETWVHRKHMLGVSIFSSHKRIFYSSSCWTHFWIKHQVPHLVWPYIHGSFCCAYYRLHHLLGHHKPNERGTYYLERIVRYIWWYCARKRSKKKTETYCSSNWTWPFRCWWLDDKMINDHVFEIP